MLFTSTLLRKNLVRNALGQRPGLSLSDLLWTKCCPVIFCLTFVLIGASALYAITDVWQGLTDPPAATSWFIGNNWFGFGSGDVISHFPPTINDDAFVTNGSTAQVAAAGATAATLTIGLGPTPGSTVQILPGGDLNVGSMIVGPQGTFRFTGGSFLVNSFQNNGAILVDGANQTLFGAVFAGSGQLIMAGTGTLTVTGSTFGGTTITSGTLQLGDGGTTGSITGDVLNNGIFAFNRSNLLTLGGSISGTGSVQQNGTGTTVLGGNNTYSGATLVSAGILQAGSATAFRVS